MAIARRGTYTSTGLTVPKSGVSPSAQTGDFLVVAFCSYNAFTLATAGVSAAAGWSSMGSAGWDDDPDLGPFYALDVYGRILASGDTSWTFTNNDSRSDAAYILAAYSGVNASPFLDGTPGGAYFSNVAPSVTVTGSDSWAIAAGGASGAPPSSPAGMTTVGTQSAGSTSITLVEQALSASGATGTRTFGTGLAATMAGVKAAAGAAAISQGWGVLTS